MKIQLELSKPEARTLLRILSEYIPHSQTEGDHTLGVHDRLTKLVYGR